MEPIASETADQSAEVERGYQAVESQPQVENEQRGNGADVTPDEQPPITTHGSEADETKQSESEQHLPPQHPETEEGGRRTPTLAYPLQELGELSMAERGEHSSGEETLIDDSSSVRTRAYDSSSSAQTLVDDDSTTDDASSFVDDGFSFTETINSMNYRFRFDAGRRYHAFEDAAYLLPNDEREQERLEGQHQMWLMALRGNLHIAPIKENVGNVLDIATGTGNWAMDFAELYPEANVFGTDLSPIQPRLRSVPPNCQFVVEDSEGEWMWDEKFDFIHSRTLGSTWRDWKGYFRKCMEYLNPSGYLEIHEFTFPFHCDDGTAGPDSPMMQWSIHFNQAAAKRGVDMEICAQLDPLLREAGFVNITKTRLRLPFTGWSDDPDEKRYGAFYGRTFDWGVSMGLFMNSLGWSRERAEGFVTAAKEDARDVDMHAYIPLYIYTAQKPEGTTRTLT